MKNIVKKRLLLGCLLAPPAPIVLVYIAILPTTSINLVNELIIPSIAMSYMGFIFVGIPVVYILNYLNKLSMIYLFISGFSFGLIYYTLLTLYFSAENFQNLNQENFIQLFTGSFFGSGVSIAFGYIVGVKLK